MGNCCRKKDDTAIQQFTNLRGKYKYVEFKDKDKKFELDDQRFGKISLIAGEFKEGII